jgi:hypothetical protein
MSNRKYISFVFCLLCLSLKLSAQEQDITGLWRGFMYNDTTQQNYRYEIAISENGKGKLVAYSHTYFIVNDKEYHGVKKLKIRRDGDEIITEDDDLIVHNYPEPPNKGIHQKNTLILKIKDTVMTLSGGYQTNRTRFFHPITGYVHVERKKDYSQSALIPHLQELGLAKNLTFLKEENNPPADQTIAVLKPMQSEEEEQLIVTAAKKQETDNNIRPATAVVKTTLPKIPEPVVTKPVVQKPAEPVVAKVSPPKTTEQPVIKKPETVVVNKPAPPKTEAPAVVKAPPAKVVETVAAPPVVAKKAEPIDPLAAIDAGKRKVENIQALYFKSDSLQLILYDNGEVDGDTVSVIMNGTVIMPRVGLSTNAVKKTIDTKDAGDSIQIVMYAESLGSLPPNTGLLIVYDGKDRYEIRFSGDMQKSSGIVFRRRKE